MIYIVHGEDAVKSRFQIINQQKKLGCPQKTELAIEEASPTSLKETLSATSLFGEPQFTVLDITNAQRMNTEPYVKILENLPEKNVLVIYAQKALPSTNTFIKNADKLKAKVIENKKEAADNIFSFVGLLFAKKRDAAYREYKKLVDNDQSGFYLITMILYGLRNIALAKFEAESFRKKPGFVKAKTIENAKKYSEEKIKELYQKIYELDKLAKSGEISEDLVVPVILEAVLN